MSHWRLGVHSVLFAFLAFRIADHYFQLPNHGTQGAGIEFLLQCLSHTHQPWVSQIVDRIAIQVEQPQLHRIESPESWETRREGGGEEERRSIPYQTTCQVGKWQNHGLHTFSPESTYAARVFSQPSFTIKQRHRRPLGYHFLGTFWRIIAGKSKFHDVNGWVNPTHHSGSSLVMY